MQEDALKTFKIRVFKNMHTNIFSKEDVFSLQMNA